MKRKLHNKSEKVVKLYKLRRYKKRRLQYSGKSKLFLAAIAVLPVLCFMLFFQGRESDKDLSKYPDQDLNKYVLEVLNSYEIGSYPYLLNEDYTNYSGVTTDIFYQDKVLLKAHPSGNKASHCVGITFEVFFKAMQERNRKLNISDNNFNGLTWDDMKDFVRTWYVANGEKKYSNCAAAIVKYGFGKQIRRLEDAKPGDFIDISRENNTGHTAVFISWLTEKGRIVGVRYWSSQESTDGINYKEEYFNIRGDNKVLYGNVMIDQVYIGRVGPVSRYKDFRR